MELTEYDGAPFRAILDGEEVRDLFAGQRPTITKTSSDPVYTDRTNVRGRTFRTVSYPSYKVPDPTPRNADGIALTPEAVEWINHPERFPAGCYVKTCEAIESESSGSGYRLCRGAFLARKKWARFCSQACRQWAYDERQRREQRQDQEGEQ